MTEKILKSKITVLLLITGAVYFFMKYISPLAAPLLVAFLIVSVSAPLFDIIRKKIHIKRTVLMSFMMIIAVAVLGILLWLFMTKAAACIPDVLDNIKGVKEGATALVQSCCDGIERRFGINADEAETLIIERVNIFIEHFQTNVMPDVVGESLSYAKNIISVAAFLAVTAIAVILLMKDYDKITAGLCNNKDSRWFMEIVWHVINYIITFLKAQIVIMLFISILASVVLAIAGVDNGVMWGIAAGILDMLPFIGTGIILIPLCVWHMFNGWYIQAVVCLLLYAGCAVLREVLEPKLIGDKVGIYPIGILAALYAGFKLFGGWGIIKGPLGLVIIRQLYMGWREKYLSKEDNGQ